MSETLNEEVQAALLALDKASEEIARRLQELAAYVNDGKLNGDVVMLKVHELAAKLMGQP